MADIATTLRTSQLEKEYKRDVSPSYREIQKPLRHARIEHTFDATPSANDNLVIGKLGLQNYEILPELCRITSLNGAIQGVVSLEKVAEDGTVTAISGSATVNDDSVALARISGNDTVNVASTDYLQLTITTVTAIVSTDIIQIDLAYVSEEAS